MPFGKSIMIDYDRLKKIFGSSGGGTYSTYKPIPKGSKVEIVIPNGSPAGSEFNGTVEPDEGYVLDITYLILDVPSGVEANIIVETDEGETPLLAENTTTGVILDASDFNGLGGIKKLTLYAKVTTTTTSDVTVSLEYGGRQVR